MSSRNSLSQWGEPIRAPVEAEKPATTPCLHQLVAESRSGMSSRIFGDQLNDDLMAEGSISVPSVEYGHPTRFGGTQADTVDTLIRPRCAVRFS